MPNKIVYEDYAVNARESAEFIGIGTVTTQLMHEINGELKDVYNIASVFSDEELSPCARFDCGGIDLSQPTHIMSYGENVGFVSNQISGSNKAFDSESQQRMRIRFMEGDFFVSGNGIGLYFDTYGCTKIKVVYTVKMPGEDNYEREFNYFGLSGSYVWLPASVDAYRMVTIEFVETEQPFQRVIVRKIEFGRKYEINDFLSLSYNKSIDFACADISIGTLETSLLSTDNLKFLKNQKIRVYHADADGGAYDLVGTYWIYSAEKATDRRYDIVAEDVFSRLEMGHEMMFGKENQIVDSARATPSKAINHLKLDTGIEADLAQEVSNSDLIGCFKSNTYRALFSEIIFSIQKFITANADGNIVFKDVDNTIIKTITSSDILGNAQFKENEKTTALKASFNNYKSRGFKEALVVYEGKIPEQGVTIIADYPISDVSIYDSAIDGDTTLEYDRVIIADRDKKISPYGYIITPRNASYLNNASVVYFSNYRSETIDEYLSVEAVAETHRKEKDFGTKAFFTEHRHERLKELLARLFSSSGIVTATVIHKDLDVGDYVSIETEYSGTLKGTVTKIDADVGFGIIAQNVEITVWE